MYILEFQLSEQWLKSLKAPQYIALTHQLSKACLTRNTIGEELTLCLTLRYLTHDLTMLRPPQRSSTTSSIFNVPIEEVKQIQHIFFFIIRENIDFTGYFCVDLIPDLPAGETSNSLHHILLCSRN